MITELDHNEWGFLGLLTKEEIHRIHAKTLYFLKHKGVKIDHVKALKMLAEAGAKIDYDQKIAKFPPELVEKSLEKVPKTITFGGRTQTNDRLVKPGGATYTRPITGAEGYIDLDTGRFRDAKASDVKELARLADALDNVSFCTTCPYPLDVPLDIRDVQNTQIKLENTEKHIFTQTYNKKNLKYIIEMALAVRGTKEELKKRPLISVLCSPLSPMQYPESAVDIMFLAGEYGIPVELAVAPIAGATGPVTIAGMLLHTNIEALAGAVLAQLANPGAPIIYAARYFICNMANGIPMNGAVENAMYSAASVQLVKELYGIPNTMRGGSTEAHVLDGQSMIERSLNMLFCSLGCTSIVNNLGSIGSSASVSPVQLVIDNEIYGMISRIYRGVEVNDDTLGLEALGRVDLGGEFLTDDHTLKYFKTEIYRTLILNRIDREVWESEGSKDMVQNAQSRAQFLIANHKTAPLADHITKELRSIVKKAEAEIVKN